MGNPLMLVLALVLATVAVQSVIAAFLGITGLTLVTSFLIGVSLVFSLKLLNIGRSFNPLTPVYSLGVAVIALALAFGTIPLGGIQPAGLPSTAASIAAPPLPASVASGVAVSDCESKVASDIRGTSATVTLNAYDIAADSPYSAAVDAGTIYIYRSPSLAVSDASNFISSTADTTANAVTGFKAGEVISMAGGNASFYTETKEGICLTGQQNSVILDTHSLETIGSFSSVVYDSTGATELGAGSQSNKYTRALGASEEQAFFWTIKINSSNNDVYLAGIQCAQGTNISSVEPGGNSASLFEKSITRLFQKDIVVNTSADSTISVTTRKDFTPWILKSPRLLKEFEEFKFQFNVKATSNDPVGAVNTTTYSGVWCTLLDKGYVRGSDGRLYLDYWDHATAEGNVGINEFLQPPNNGRAGFQLDIT